MLKNYSIFQLNDLRKFSAFKNSISPYYRIVQNSHLIVYSYSIEWSCNHGLICVIATGLYPTNKLPKITRFVTGR